jgi:hypothetical protein
MSVFASYVDHKADEAFNAKVSPTGVSYWLINVSHVSNKDLFSAIQEIINFQCYFKK